MVPIMRLLAGRFSYTLEEVAKFVGVAKVTEFFGGGLEEFLEGLLF